MLHLVGEGRHHAVDVVVCLEGEVLVDGPIHVLSGDAHLDSSVCKIYLIKRYVP